MDFKETVERIMEENPDLNSNGWKYRDTGANDHWLWRRQMAREPALAEFERATEYLARCKRQKTVTKLCSSYGWKHQAEAYYGGKHGGGGYVSNGMFNSRCHRARVYH